MEDKKERIARLRAIIQSTYGCKAAYRRTVRVQERVEGTEWKGEVDVFWLTGHPGAKRCYAWLREDVGGKSEPMAVLEDPPVIGPATAVRAALGNQLPS